MSTPETEPLSPLKRALIEIRELKARNAAAEQREHEPIALVGMGMRFPGGVDSPDSLWRVLWDGVDTITEVPPDRWSNSELYDPNPEAPGKLSTKFGGFLSAIDQFDASFFGISPREAEAIDPQQRLLLEVTWEALEHARIPADSLFGTDAGVFLGIANSDYFRMLLSDAEQIDTYTATGNALSVAAGRLSYILGTHGPAMAVDTACSSSLVAVHLATQALRNRECDLALAGGANLILTPELTINFSRAGMLSPDGRCKTFDAAADGYVRSEGCGMVVLKRLSDAQAQGDRILAVIRGSAVNHDGRSGGLTAPNGPSQEKVIAAALTNASVQPNDISYVETHGTGTQLGDPIEVGALGAALCTLRPLDRPLLIGSVKTNLGHMETAAGIGGLIKLVLMLQHRQIPPHLNLKQLSPHIAAEGLPISVPTERTEWPVYDSGNGNQPGRLAGLSSFGLSGTNAHIIVGEMPPTTAPSNKPTQSLDVLTISAKTPQALDALAARYADYLRSNPDQTFGDIAFAANTGRSHFAHRLAVIASSTPAAATLLDGFAGGETSEDVVSLGAAPVSTEVAFVFAGDGSHYPGMGRQLYAEEPEFAAAIDRCDSLLRDELKHGLREILVEANGLLDSPMYSGPALFSLQYALLQLWCSWGVRPTVVAGHETGEYVAACAAGVMSLEDGLRLACVRGRVLSSPLVDQSLDGFERVLSGVGLARPQLPVVSSVTGTFAEDECSDPGYWRRQLQQPARLTGVFERLREAGLTTIVEIGPDATLVKLGQECWPDGHGTCLPSMRHDGAATGGEALQIVRALAGVYTAGVDVDWTAFAQRKGRRRSDIDPNLTLPNYPWQRESYWSSAALPNRPHGSVTTAASAWPSVIAAAQQQAELGPLDLRIETYEHRWSLLNQISGAAIAKALWELGFFRVAGESHTAREIMSKGRIAAVYEHLVAKWLEHLAEDGWLVAGSDRTFMSPKPLSAPDLASMLAAAAPEFSGVEPLLDYVRRCSDKLAAVISGDETALNTLFPDGSYETVDFLYSHWAVPKYFNNLVRSAVAAAIEARPGRKLRVLEIGAGTGGTSAAVIPALPADRTYYAFTDVSDFFLARAAERFAAYSFVHYSQLDIEGSPADQGHPLGSYDVVVAANVLHATKDLDATLGHARSLLAPGGLLIAYECTQHHPWFDITTGLIEGWQRFEDDWRQGNPLIDSHRWTQALLGSGFDDVVALPEEGSPTTILGQHVLIARAPGDSSAVPTAWDSERGTDFALQSTRSPTGQRPVGRDVRDALAAAMPDERHEVMVAFVRRVIAQVLRVAAPERVQRDQPLLDLGFDSLMAVELRNVLRQELDLETNLPATIVFDHPTVSAIASYLGEMLALLDHGAAADEQSADEGVIDPPSTNSLAADGLAALSEEEVEALLLKKLEEIEP